MGDPKENPAPVAAGSGAGIHNQSTADVITSAWQRWALNARLGRLSARQRRVVALAATGLAATPEHAFRMLDARV